MPFALRWTTRAGRDYAGMKSTTDAARSAREVRGESKSSKAEGLFRQVAKTVARLAEDPKHPGLNCHEFTSLDHPFDPKGKVWEAYVQNNTPGVYRLFWCYGPDKGQITVIAITPHP